MRDFEQSEFQSAGAEYGRKLAKIVYKKFGADAAILGDLLQDVSPESLIQADADEIIAEIGGMDSAQEKILKSICNSVNKAIIKDFPVIEDDFNFEDDFADEYGDSPANVYNIAFWNAFDDTLNQLQMQ
jgi:hypothetical protein